MDFETVRKKYPQYGDMSDEQLAKALHQKFYSDMEFGEFSNKIGYSGEDYPESTFLNPPEGETQLSQNRPKRQALSKVYTPILEGAGFIGGALVGGAAGAPTGPGAMATGAVAAGTGYAIGKSSAKRIDELTGIRKPQNLKEAATESVTDIASGTTMEIGGQLVGKYIISPIVASASEELSKIIRSGMTQGVRPSVKGKINNPAIELYMDKAESGIKTIITNKDSLRLTDKNGGIVSGKLPKTLKQFSEAIDQTKKNIFEQYDELKRLSGESGAVIELKPIANQLFELAENEVLKTESPAIAKFAMRKGNEYLKQGSYTPSQAQDAIASINGKLLEYYQSGKVGFAGRKSVEDLAATNLRASLDDVIGKTTGNQSYQDLKHAYGALRTIEKDVAHRTQIDARKNKVGFFGYADIWTAAEAVQAIVDPTKIPKVIAIQGTKRWINWINNPNRIVGKMFKNAERYVDNLPKTVQKELIESTPLKQVEKQILRYNPEFKFNKPPLPPTVKTQLRPGETPYEMPVKEKLLPDQRATVIKGKSALSDAKAKEAGTGPSLIKPKSTVGEGSKPPEITIEPKAHELPQSFINLMKQAKKSLPPNKAKHVRATALKKFNKTRRDSGLPEFTIKQVEEAIKARQRTAKIKINTFRKSKGLSEWDLK